MCILALDVFSFSIIGVRFIDVALWNDSFSILPRIRVRTVRSSASGNPKASSGYRCAAIEAVCGRTSALRLFLTSVCLPEVEPENKWRSAQEWSYYCAAAWHQS